MGEDPGVRGHVIGSHLALGFVEELRDGRIRHVREYATKKEGLEAAGLRE